jgi:chaperonin GroEL
VPYKQIAFDKDAREKLLKGASYVDKAVGSTLGPRSSYVAIDRGYDMWVIKDGVNVARQIHLKDLRENAGVRLIREAANKTVDAVGDGTTATVILAYAMMEESNKMISSGIHAMSLRQGLESGADKILKRLDQIKVPVKTIEEKIQIATISANGDSELGKMIGETIDRIGADGVLTVEESKSAETYVELQEGMQFDKGYISPYFITDDSRMEATVEDTKILITDMNLSNINLLLPLLEKVGAQGRNLVVIAQDVADSALASFILTKKNGGMNLNAVQATGVGQKMKDFLQDIAILTGGKVITEDMAQRFDEVTVADLGTADRVTSTKDATIIVGGKGDKKLIQDRIKSIRAQLERDEGSDFEIEKLRERIAKLTNGVAVVNVGGNTEIEMKERKERADDAISSTQAAVLEGIVAGGEVVYLTAREVLDRKDPAEAILYNALVKPFERLYTNAGYTSYDMIPLLMNRKITEGVDMLDGKLKDMFKAGIIDAVSVPKAAIKNAVSVAIQVITSNTLIVDEPEVKK